MSINLFCLVFQTLEFFVVLFLQLTQYFLIAAINAQIFNPTAELKIPIGIPTNGAKAEI